MFFADAFYWVALVFPRDSAHHRVLSFSRTMGQARLVTTDEVLTEVLNHLSHRGPYWRSTADALVHDLRVDPHVDVMAQSRADFDAALAFYESRLDKLYSLTDCRSMVAMQTLGIKEALTNDHHFTQEGFSVLFP
jgi:predicted nucleic acid-binding protein